MHSDHFESAHSIFIQKHLTQRSGERRGRLERGHAHAEILFTKNVWWSLKGNFDHLHPEYEVVDWRGRSYFADFLYDNTLVKIIIEIKGFSEHVTNMDRNKYCNELNRESFLFAMGYHVISFSYDDVAYRPELCTFLLRSILSRFEITEEKVGRDYFADHEIMRLAVMKAEPIRPIDVTKHFLIDHRTAVKYLKRLCQKGWIQPLYHANGQRIRYYQITKSGFDHGLL